MVNTSLRGTVKLATTSFQGLSNILFDQNCYKEVKVPNLYHIEPCSDPYLSLSNLFCNLKINIHLGKDKISWTGNDFKFLNFEKN